MESDILKGNSNDELAKRTNQESNIRSDEIQHTDYIYMVNGHTMIISMNAELDHHLADEMRMVMDEVIDNRGVCDIIFDFSKVNFMDSSGIGLIMGRYKKIRNKGHIYVSGANQSVQRILLISGLHKIVGIFKDVNSAICDIRRGAGVNE